MPAGAASLPPCLEMHVHGGHVHYTPGNVRTTDSHEMWLEGRRLSAADANALELSLAENPNDVRARIKLLGYYSVDWQRSHNESGAGHPPARLTCLRRSAGNRSTNESGCDSSLIPRSRSISRKAVGS